MLSDVTLTDTPAAAEGKMTDSPSARPGPLRGERPRRALGRGGGLRPAASAPLRQARPRPGALTARMVGPLRASGLSWCPGAGSGSESLAPGVKGASVREGEAVLGSGVSPGEAGGARWEAA